MGHNREESQARLRCFGGLSLLGAARPLSGATVQRRPLALLAVLAVAGERGVTRDRLQALLWPESDTERARRVLAQTLYALRRDLGDAAAILGTSDPRLNPEVVHADVAEFERAFAAGEDERAMVLYAGPFLEGVHLTDAPEFEQWAEGERDRLARRAREVLQRLAKGAETRGDWEVAVGWWRRLAALDPLSGRIATRLMQALAAAGDVAAALGHARIHDTLLREELGAPPDASVTALAARLRTPTGFSAGIPGAGTTSSSNRLAPLSAPPQPTLSSTERESASAFASDLSALPPPAAQHPASPHLDDPDRAARVPSAYATHVLLSAPATDVERHSTVVTTGRRNAHRGGIRWLGLFGVAGAALVVAAVVWASRGRRNEPPDPALVVVAPFDVADPGLELWREGMVDVLSRNLDGAGPLRTVSPSKVVREWRGRADRETVATFARSLGAGSAVYGGLMRAGPDSVLATLALLDLQSGRLVLEVRRLEALARMDRLTDTLTFALVRSLAERVPLGAVSLLPLKGGTSVESLRSFLRTEEFYRRVAWDSAVAHYERTLAADPSLSLR